MCVAGSMAMGTVCGWDEAGTMRFVLVERRNVKKELRDREKMYCMR